MASLPGTPEPYKQRDKFKHLRGLLQLVTKYYYDNSLPSTGDQVYKCGLHDYETKSLTEFNRHVEDHGSKAALHVLTR